MTRPRPRFRIKRSKPFDPTESRPWKLADASRPAYIGNYATHAAALRAIDDKVRDERGLPRVPVSRREIRQAMSA